ncbi:SDR family NAD(P)-dependent oxidoreductase [Pseudolysinimonas sp.]|uniref:SDR family NAD(P)-dependent oxidoreductase n=1 Tax=Pseudolysinimonas sp. TaxID=2680009 RepID=UPI00286BB637|nr:SDR family NAD(P)-dependent oxidoreductase [Pseudolysinimonas sp.]
MSWDPRSLPSQAGRTIVVTGGSTGIGYWASEQLAGAGSRVIIAARYAPKAAEAIASIRARVPGADVTHVPLDLTSLTSVRQAAATIAALGGADVLVNNAGLVFSPARRTTTDDGLELLVGGNFVGHFALTALVFPVLRDRVVGLGSLSTRMTRLEPDDLMSEKTYRPFRAYAFSKHAVHGFAFELDRRLRAAGDARGSLLAHPGYAVNELSEKRPDVITNSHGWQRLGGYLSAPVGQGKDHGAWPVVRAAIDPHAESGEFYGPRDMLGMRGTPVVQAPVASSASPDFGAHLWALAEQWSGVPFPIPSVVE